MIEDTKMKHLVVKMFHAILWIFFNEKLNNKKKKQLNFENESYVPHATCQLSHEPQNNPPTDCHFMLQLSFRLLFKVQT